MHMPATRQGSSAEVYLHGAHVTSWKSAAGEVRTHCLSWANKYVPSTCHGQSSTKRTGGRCAERRAPAGAHLRQQQGRVQAAQGDPGRRARVLPAVRRFWPAGAARLCAQLRLRCGRRRRGHRHARAAAEPGAAQALPARVPAESHGARPCCPRQGRPDAPQAMRSCRWARSTLSQAAGRCGPLGSCSAHGLSTRRVVLWNTVWARQS